MFARNAFWNSAGNMALQAGRVVQDLGARWMLPPVIIGLWELVNLVRRLTSTFDLGFIPAAKRDLPVLRGRGDRDGEVAYRSTAFFAHGASRVLLSAGVIVYWALTRDRHTAAESLAFFGGAGMVLLYGVTEPLAAFYQNALKYRTFGRTTIVYSAVATPAVLAATYWWGVWGLVCATLGGLMLYATLLARRLRSDDVTITRVWRTDVLRRLVRFAIPLRVVDYPQLLLREIDLLLVARFLGLGPLAIYGTAKLVLSQGIQLPAWVGQVVILRLNERTGASVPRDRLAAEMRRYLTFLDLVVLPLLICSVYLGFALIVPIALPEYVGSIDVVGIMLLTMFFMPQTTLVRNVWILDKRLLALFVNGLLGLTITAGALGLFVSLQGWSLAAVAEAYLLGHVLYYVITMMTVGREFLGARGALEIQAYVGVAALITAIVIGTIPDWGASGSDGPANVLLRMLVLVLPLVVLGVRGSRAVSYFSRLRRAPAVRAGAAE